MRLFRLSNAVRRAALGRLIEAAYAKLERRLGV